ncbi:MAG: CHRD domain-containing protein [Planctomycetota bacterium]
MFHRFYRVLLLCSCGVALIALLTPVVDASAATPQRLLMIGGGVQVVPPSGSPAFCAGTFEVDTANNTCTYSIVVSALASGEIAANICGPADPGVNGAVLHALPAGKTKAGVWNYPEASEADLLDGKMYVNIESTAFPSGELRGQISDMVCTLDAEQVLPVVTSPTSGFGVFQIDTDANLLSYHIFYDPILTSGEFAAHIHVPATHGDVQVGTPPHTLPGGPLKQGTWNYSENYEEALLTGRAYVLVHSTQFLGGEVRGQIGSSLSLLEPGQVLPPVTTDGVGYVLFSVDKDTDTLGYDLRFADLTGTESATVVHGPAPVGASAPAIFTMPMGPRKVTKEIVSASIVQHFFDCQLYIDVHTSTFSGGELRGQLIPRDLPPRQFVRGDCNADGSYNIADPVRLLGFAFPSPPPAVPLACDDACDCNDDGILNIADAVCMLTGLFGMPAVPPSAPHPSCGEDPTPDSLDCANIVLCP